MCTCAFMHSIVLCLLWTQMLNMHIKFLSLIKMHKYNEMQTSCASSYCNFKYFDTFFLFRATMNMYKIPAGIIVVRFFYLNIDRDRYFGLLSLSNCFERSRSRTPTSISLENLSIVLFLKKNVRKSMAWVGVCISYQVKKANILWYRTTPLSSRVNYYTIDKFKESLPNSPAEIFG